MCEEWVEQGKKMAASEGGIVAGWARATVAEAIGVTVQAEK